MSDQERFALINDRLNELETVKKMSPKSDLEAVAEAINGLRTRVCSLESKSASGVDLSLLMNRVLALEKKPTALGELRMMGTSGPTLAEVIELLRHRVGVLETVSEAPFNRINILSNALSQMKDIVIKRVEALEKKFEALGELKTMGASGPKFKNVWTVQSPPNCNKDAIGSTTPLPADASTISWTAVVDDLIAQRDEAWAKLTAIKNILADYTAAGYIRSRYIRDIIDGVKSV